LRQRPKQPPPLQLPLLLHLPPVQPKLERLHLHLQQMLPPPKKTSKPAGSINPPWLIRAWRVFSLHTYKSKLRRDTVLLKKF
jgi:hypothetical protein